MGCMYEYRLGMSIIRVAVTPMAGDICTLVGVRVSYFKSMYQLNHGKLIHNGIVQLYYRPRQRDIEYNAAMGMINQMS